MKIVLPSATREGINMRTVLVPLLEMYGSAHVHDGNCTTPRGEVPIYAY